MKKANIFIVTAALLLGISSCSDKQTKITILGENSSSIHAMQASQADYEAVSDVKLEFRPHSFEDAFNRANQDFANKTGQYDIVLQYNFSLSSFVRNNYVYKLDELKSQTSSGNYDFENDIFENIWKEVGYYYSNPSNPNDNQIEAVSYPFAANTMLLAYNQELFNNVEHQNKYLAKYGTALEVPTDWATFRQVAEYFTQADKNLQGVALQGATGGWLYYEWCGVLQGFGGKVLDKEQGWQGNESTPVLIDNQQAVAATEYFLSLKPYNAGNFVTTDGAELVNLLKKGNVAMGFIWSDYSWGLVNKGNGTFDERFAFAPVPGNKSMIAGGSYFINRQTKNAEAAFDYMTYLLKKETQIEMIQQGLCAPTKSAYDAPEAQKVPYVPALKTSLERAEYMLEAGPDADLISNVITTYIQRIWNNEVSVEAGLKAAKAEIEKERIKFYQ